MHCPFQHLVQPDRQVRTIVLHAAVAEPQLSGTGGRLGQLGTIREVAGQHVIGNHAQGKQVRPRGATQTEEVFRRRVLQGTKHGRWRCRSIEFLQTGDLHRAEIDDLHRPGPVDHDVLRAQVLVQHIQPLKGPQPLGNLLDDITHLLQVRLRVVEHPLMQGLALDELADAVEITPLARQRRGLGHMGAVDPPGDPLLQHEPLEILAILPLIGGGNLEHQPFAGLPVRDQIYMAAAAGMQLALHGETVKLGAAFQQRRRRQVRQLATVFGHGKRRQVIDAHQLHRQVIGAAQRQRLLDDALGSGVQIAVVLGKQRIEPLRIKVFMDAVGGQQKQIATLNAEREMVDLQMGADPQGPGKIAVLGRYLQTVIPGQLLKVAAAQPVDARIAHMEQVGGGGFDDQRTEGAHIPPVGVLARRAPPGLAMEPGIGGRQYPLRRFAHRPGIRRAVVIRQEPRHCRLAGDMADRAAADAVGQHRHGALGAELRFCGHTAAMAVLIYRLTPPVRSLTEGDIQTRSWRDPTGHRSGLGGRCHATWRTWVRLGAVRTWVVYSVSPVKAKPPTRLPSAVGISFQIM